MASERPRGVLCNFSGALLHVTRTYNAEQGSTRAAVIEGGHLRRSPGIYSKYENINYRQRLLVAKENKQHSLLQTSALSDTSTQSDAEV